jgi:uncharacterized protein YndB with AHSA1/START domain
MFERGCRWHFKMRRPDGTVRQGVIQFDNIHPHRQISFTSDGAGPMNVGGELYAIVDFEKTGTGTRIRLTMRPTSSPGNSGAIVPSGARDGAEQALVRLAHHVESAGETPEEESVRLVQDLVVSREAAWSVWNDPERVFDWWGSEGAGRSTIVQDLRPGGVRVLTWRGRNGVEHLDRMVFETVDAPHRLTYAHYSRGDGNGRPRFHARVDFAAAGDGDVSRLTMALFFTECGLKDRRDHYRAIDDAEERLRRFATMLKAN